jgi:uncharacterized C2H2 Zn-finger protein
MKCPKCDYIFKEVDGNVKENTKFIEFSCPSCNSFFQIQKEISLDSKFELEKIKKLISSAPSFADIYIIEKKENGEFKITCSFS